MKQYHELLQAILDRGTYKEPAREGMPGTTSLFGYQLRHNLQEGFPLLTTKKMFWKGVVIELLWFLRGDTNIKYLVDNGVNIWNEDAYNYYLKVFKKHGSYAPMEYDVFVEFIQKGFDAVNIDPKCGYVLGDCGYQYGKVWRDWQGIDQLAKVIQNIKSKPYDRRKLVTAVDPAHDEDLALYWCHAMFQFNCRPINYHVLHEDLIHADLRPSEVDRYVKENNLQKYYLDCQLYQRSADVFLGVPFNIASYALLTYIVAAICNMIPGDFIHTFGDVHIYDNHMEQVKEQLTRDPEKYNLPELKMDAAPWQHLNDLNFNKFMLEDFELIGYESYPAIKAELSTGLKR